MENNKKKVEKYNVLYEKKKNIICWIVTSWLFVSYIYYFFTMEPLIHPETWDYGFGYVVNKGDFFSLMIKHVFDLNIIEGGFYRPRALAFLIEYIDMNMLQRIINIFPGWGLRLPLVIPAAGLLVYSISLLVKQIFPKFNFAMGALAGSAALFFINYQVATYVMLRTAKLITPSVCILIFVWMLRWRNYFVKKDSIMKTIWGGGGLLFVLCTLDEQVLFIVAACMGLAYLWSFFKRKTNLFTLSGTIALLIYGSYHLVWGRAIFQYFTKTPLLDHPHQIRKSVESINWTIFVEAYECLRDVLTALFGNKILLILVVAVIAAAYVKMADWKERLFATGLLLLPFVLIMLLISGHSAVYELVDLRYGMYLITPVLFFLAGSLYIISHSTFTNKEWTLKLGAAELGIAVWFLLALLALPRINIFTGVHLVENGGHLGRNLVGEELLYSKIGIEQHASAEEYNTFQLLPEYHSEGLIISLDQDYNNVVNDEIMNTNNMIGTTLTGWVYDEGANDSVSALYLVIDGIALKADVGVVRDNDTASYQNSNIQDMGFKVNVLEERLLNANNVNFIAISADGTYRMLKILK